MGYRELRVTFAIDDTAWRKVADTARVVFRDCPYFTLVG